ncbi:MAG: tRNA (adenosine(37)-N6)-threonylcarbamoyltransferase complex dimerization subunit type 1 TsaB [Balneolaceae bacterium]|nr:tRNA (adenosine(37)-N6)-threonylcarbamoyltransferase complex dimerization subunit type 1 TsaB [Balneolaceae bacterium]
MQLALETSTNTCSVAFKNDKAEVYERRTEVRGSHSEQLFLFIDELKKEYKFEIPDLDSVIVSEGPGSYTGLRISASAIKGLLFQQDVILLAANTLASFAAGVVVANDDISRIQSIIDARRVHVYHQQFEVKADQLQAIGNVEVRPIKKFEQMVKDGDAIIGTGIHRLDKKSISKVKIFDESYISAKSLFALQELDRSAQFIKEADIQSFDPKYYSSNQVADNK